MRFDGQVVLVTGSSRGLGKALAICLAEAGATIVVNSTGDNDKGRETAANIIAAGGRAIHIAEKVENATALVAAVVESQGRIDSIIHNAGFVRDKTVRKMTTEQWDDVQNVHLRSAFLLSQSAWPYFEAQGGGRLVFLSSAAGIYGNFGQSSYAAAKIGLYGLCRTIALEGMKANIACNCVAPLAVTDMNVAIMPEDIKPKVRAEYVAPLLAYLAHFDCDETGGLFEAGAGCFKKLRWERSAGLSLDTNIPLSVEDIARGWQKVSDFSQSEHPEEMVAALRMICEDS